MQAVTILFSLGLTLVGCTETISPTLSDPAVQRICTPYRELWTTGDVTFSSLPEVCRDGLVPKL